jgi:hypothetical protein
MPRSEHDNRTNSSVKSTHLRSVICGQPTSALTQPMGDSVQLTLRVARQVCVLGQVPAQQPVGIFTGATLPRAVRIGKENLDRKPPEPNVRARLSRCLDRRSRFGQQSRHMPKLLGKPLTGPRGIPSRPSCQDKPGASSAPPAFRPPIHCGRP